MTYRAYLSKTVALALSLGLLGACAAPEPEATQPSQIACYGVKPQDRTVYRGSDKRFHYFAWTHGLKSGAWKVPRYALELVGEFPLGNGESFAKHNAAADLILFGFTPAKKQ